MPTISLDQGALADFLKLEEEEAKAEESKNTAAKKVTGGLKAPVVKPIAKAPEVKPIAKASPPKAVI